MLLRMYLRWAERRGFDVELDEVSPGNEAGISSATFLVNGRHAYGRLRSEHGVHRLVRMSPFNAQGKRQTAFAALKVTPFLDDRTHGIFATRSPARTPQRAGRPGCASMIRRSAVPKLRSTAAAKRSLSRTS